MPIGLFGPNVEKMKAKRDVAGLIPLLGHKEGDIRLKAIAALGDLCDPAAVEPLAGVFNRSDSGDVLMQAAEAALVKIGPPAVEPLILRLARSDHYSLRCGSVAAAYAAETLGRIGDPRAVKPLILVLDFPELVVRKCATVALGQLGDPSAAQALTERLLDFRKYSPIYRFAANALDKLGWQPKSDGPSAVYWLAKSRVDRITAIGAPAVDPISEFLYDRVETLSIFWKNPGLSTVLANTDTPEEMAARRDAAEALGRLGARRAVTLLTRLLDDHQEFVRAAASAALESLKK